MATQAKIIILTGSSLCQNPRVMKEATALVHAGYDVEVLGGWVDARAKESDRELIAASSYRFTPVFDITRNTPTRAMLRIRRKLAALVHRVGCENRWQLGYAYPALYLQAARRDAALFIAHSEQAMAAAVKLLGDGRRVGVDMEDWFSQDLLPEARRQRPIRLLNSLESALLRGGSFASTTSEAMSLALAAAYNCPPPLVIYNAFAWSERRSIDGLRKDRRDLALQSVHWFSQTLGPGRGVEDLLAALPLVKHPFEIHLRGNSWAGYLERIKEQAPPQWRDRIHHHVTVSNAELLSRIAEHDIGLASELTYCRSRDLTVTNKILYYLLAGTAVVASNTEGQREVAGYAPRAVALYPSGNPVALAECLDALLASPEALGQAKRAALQAAERIFCWERQEPKLIEMVKGAIDRTFLL